MQLKAGISALEDALKAGYEDFNVSNSRTTECAADYSSLFPKQTIFKTC